ncbi:MAG: SDR family NAD(P)-dependent oxidoreductase [Cyanobacteriota bacterium]
MSPDLLLFGAGGALGSAIAAHLLGQGYTLHTAGGSTLPGAASHLPLIYDAPLEASAFSALPSLEAVVWAQGVNCSDTVASFEAADLQRLLQGNVLFIASSLQALLAAGRLRKGCRLVVVSSIWQLESRPGKFSYTVSKAAPQGLVKSCALDLGPRGIVINAVLPGVVDTPMTRAHLSTEQIAAITAQSALGRLPQPTDIAAAVGFLASPANRAITGQFLTVDAGFIGLKRA